jgi:hypothetical protein
MFSKKFRKKSSDLKMYIFFEKQINQKEKKKTEKGKK